MRKPLSFVFTLFCVLVFTQTYAQGENNIWTFGEYQGLDFNLGFPAPTHPDSIFTFKAAASLCDAAGNMKFYTNGSKIWDKNNHRMPNGLSLNGNTSATQGAAISQSLSNPDQYFVFYISTQGKLYYSMVDMSLNFGFGDVIATQKNILIDSTLSEKMIVVRGIACQWLIVHERLYNNFHCLKIDNSGINAPIISASGFYTGSNTYQTGEMKISPDNNTLVLANTNRTVELHTFDNVEGGVYNAIKLDSLASGAVYGSSFSPDGSKLYIGLTSGFNGQFLFQYDLSLLPNIAAVQASRTNLAVATVGGMRISPDNKIYATNPYANMSIIQDPNVAGTGCNYTYQVYGPVIKGNAFETGLGNPFIPYCAPSEIVTDTTACMELGPVIVTAPGGYTSYKWNDSTTGQTNSFTAAGTKWVYAYNGCDVLIDTFKMHAGGYDTSSITSTKDTTVCFANNIPVFSASAGYTTYLWSDGMAQQQDTFSSPGIKWVYGRVGCNLHIDSFKVQAGYDTTWARLDTTMCVAYIPRVIAAPGGYTSYLWSDGATTQTDTFFASTTKWVRGLNTCMLLIDTIHFTATNIPQDSVFTHTTDSTICFEALSNITVHAQTGYSDYLWNDGTPGMSNTFTSPGTKWVYAQTACLMLVDTFSVFNAKTDTTIKYHDTDVCFQKQVTLTAAEGYLTYLWNTGSNAPTNLVTSTSVNWVNMHNACVERIDTFNVRLVDELAVSLGSDSALCKGQSLQVDASSVYQDATYKWQDNSTSAQYTITKGGNYWVKVSVGNCYVSDTIRIQDKKLNLNLGDGHVPCGKSELVLDAGPDNSTYKWSDGSTEKTLRVTTNGSYTVHVTDGSCSADAAVNVIFEGCPCVVSIPNAFSPNQDGRNDKFGAITDCPVNDYQCKIYNRWGNLVFYSEDIRDRWDGSYKGTPQDHDLFYYFIQFKDASGHSYYYKGDVTLVK